MKNMKKTVAAVLAVILMVCGCAAACAEEKVLTPEEARQIALDYAGLKADRVTFTKCRQDWDDGRMVYELEFFADGVSYEMDVDVYSGRISDVDTEHHVRYGQYGDDDDDDDWDDWFDFD